MRANQKPLNWLIGLTTLGGGVTGALAVLLGLLALVRGDLAASGVCLTAAALAFGLLANALLRH
jgi:hypothetical protein